MCIASVIRTDIFLACVLLCVYLPPLALHTYRPGPGFCCRNEARSDRPSESLHHMHSYRDESSQR